MLAQKTDVSREEPDQTADRLITFLKIVKYKPTMDGPTFRQLLAAGDKEAVYPILKWVLPQSAQLEKRAVVGYYLSSPEMPEDLNFDPDVMELKDDIRTLQAEFVEVHKAAEAARAVNKDAQALRNKIKQLEEEKERLADKVERAKGQVAGVHDRAALLEVCSALRRQQDEQISLSGQLSSQAAALEKAEAARHKVAARLRELTASSSADASPEVMLAALREDVAALRSQVSERYPLGMERRQKRLAAVQDALHNSVSSEMDLQRLAQQAAGLQAAIAEIGARREAADKARAGNKAYLQLRQAQQMAQMVGRKKEEVNAKLERLEEKRAALQAAFERQAAAEQGGATAGPAFTEEEWRRKYESMKEKLPTYKKLKKELGDLEAEVFVLGHTEEVLGAQEGALKAAVRQAEAASGVRGFADVASTLEKVSEAKSALDEAKGMTLQEISRTVEEINAAIRERKGKLAPQIKALRAVREQFTALEGELEGQRSQLDSYMSAGLGPNARSEVAAMRADVAGNERKYHLLSCQLHVTDTDIKRVTGPNAERLKDRAQAKVAEAESFAKRVREQQKVLKEAATSGVTQMDMMSDLIRLLKLKLELQTGGGQALESHQAPPQSYDTARGNVFVL